jgi:hypothetical protein
MDVNSSAADALLHHAHAFSGVDALLDVPFCHRFSLLAVGGGAFTDGVAFDAPLTWELTRCGPNGTILFNNSSFAKPFLT